MIKLFMVLSGLFNLLFDYIVIQGFILWAGYMYGLQLIPEFYLGVPLEDGAIICLLLAVISKALSLLCRQIARFFIHRTGRGPDQTEELSGSQPPADSQ